MNTKVPIVLGLAGVLIAGAAAGELRAACNPSKDFKLAFSDEGDYFIDFPADAKLTFGAIKGRFWQAGARAIANEGDACPEVTYLIRTGPSQLTFFGQSGADILGTGPCDNLGCVVGSQLMLIQTVSSDGARAYYAVGRVNETVGEYRYNRGGTDWDAVAIPRPRVTSTSRADNRIVVNLTLDPPTGAHGEADGFARNWIVTGYQLVRFEGGADPGRDPAVWTNVGSALSVNENVDTPAVYQDFTCPSNGADVFIAMRPVFDDGEFMGDYVGASTRLECDPALAEPRFDRINRSKSGRGAIRTNPR